MCLRTGVCVWCVCVCAEMAFMHMHGGKDLWQYYNEDENKEELTSFQKMFDEISRTRFLPFFALCHLSCGADGIGDSAIILFPCLLQAR